MVDEVQFTSYYGRPIIKAPVWKTPDVPLYLFLGGPRGRRPSSARWATSAAGRRWPGRGGSSPAAARSRRWVS